LELRNFLGKGIQPVDKLKPQAPVVAAGGGQCSFAQTVGSGDGGNSSELKEKGKEKITGEILNSGEHSKQLVNGLILNMENMGYGKFSNQLGVVQLNLNIHLECGIDGAWSVKNASVIDSPYWPGPHGPHLSQPTERILNQRGCSISAGPSPSQAQKRPVLFTLDARVIRPKETQFEWRPVSKLGSSKELSIPDPTPHEPQITRSDLRVTPNLEVSETVL
jgi:hypothetical protein